MQLLIDKETYEAEYFSCHPCLCTSTIKLKTSDVKNMLLPKVHHVLIGDQDVHLTLNEFKIVALLGKYAGKVLTYDYLIKQIWGPKAKADNQILRVNMANIRRKIEKNPASPEYIFTEIGVGYRMLENDA